MKRPIALGASAILLAVGLSGCVSSSWNANPQGVTLHGRELAVMLYDGTVCRANIAGATSGRLQNCPTPLRYDVTIESDPLVPGASAILETRSTVVLYGENGRQWTYLTPSIRGATGDNIEPPMAFN